VWRHWTTSAPRTARVGVHPRAFSRPRQSCCCSRRSQTSQTDRTHQTTGARPGFDEILRVVGDFEQRYGFWRVSYDAAVAKYLDCGLFESGFARVVCPQCRSEFLVGFSWKGRGLCPSCEAKRAAIFSELLRHQILADIPQPNGFSRYPKCFDPTFCIIERFWESWHDSPTKPSTR